MRSGPVMEAMGLHRWLGEGESRVHVLRGVDLRVSPGRTCAVIGPSGCGKSTLLYLLGLLDRPDRGSVVLDGRDMASTGDDARTAARNAHIGFVFQFHFLLPEFTALENVMLPMLRLGAWPEDILRDQARQLLQEVGLEEKAERFANQLSGGEQQRVAIARALANRPRVVLADEPTGNLDARNSAMVFELLQKVARERHQAILIVSHNLDLAGRCDEVRSMRDGRFV